MKTRTIYELIIALAMAIWGGIAIYHLLPPQADPNAPMYHLETPSIEPPQRNPCLEPSVDHRRQVIAKAILEKQVPASYASALLNSPTDRLRNAELIMLCRIISEDCNDCR